MKPFTYRELLEALKELPSEQLLNPVMVAKGRKLIPVKQVALSCECQGPAIDQVGENYPLLLCQ